MANHLAPKDLLVRDLWVLLEEEKDGQGQELKQTLLEQHKQYLVLWAKQFFHLVH